MIARHSDFIAGVLLASALCLSAGVAAAPPARRSRPDVSPALLLPLHQLDDAGGDVADAV